MPQSTRTRLIYGSAIISAAFFGLAGARPDFYFFTPLRWGGYMAVPAIAVAASVTIGTFGLALLAMALYGRKLPQQVTYAAGVLLILLMILPIGVGVAGSRSKNAEICKGANPAPAITDFKGGYCLENR